MKGGDGECGEPHSVGLLQQPPDQMQGRLGSDFGKCSRMMEEVKEGPGNYKEHGRLGAKISAQEANVYQGQAHQRWVKSKVEVEV